MRIGAVEAGSEAHGTGGGARRCPAAAIIAFAFVGILIVAACIYAEVSTRALRSLKEYDPVRDASFFDEATDGSWTTPLDGPLTVVLYTDGDLVFQYGDSTDPGREIAEKWVSSIRPPMETISSATAWT